MTQNNVHLILQVFALVCFVLSTWQPATEPFWRRLIGAGLAFLTASFMSW